MVSPENFIKFKVTDKQWNFAHKIGMARFNSKNKYASTRNLSKINTHICGATAEVVFGQWQGFSIDTTIHKTKGDKFDFISRHGETTDVKHSTFAGPDIELKEKVENVTAGKLKDIYVLCRAIITNNKVSEVWVLGWIAQNDFIQDKNKRSPYVLNNPKYPWNYVVGLDKLEPFTDKKYGVEMSEDWIATIGI